MGLEPVCNKFQKQTIMKNLFVKIAGMSVCVLGVLSTTSCSKEDFFGLEDSELNYSQKTEIALSREFADYAISCSNLAKEMKTPVDTAEMQVQRAFDGKPIYFSTGSNESVKKSLDELKKAYPELAHADQYDFDEILEIALSQNKSLKGLTPKKKTKSTDYYWGESYSDFWIWTVSDESDRHEFTYDGDGYWTFTSFNSDLLAISHVVWNCGENAGFFPQNGGGLIFLDNSAVAFVGNGQDWPDIAGGGPQSNDFYLPYIYRPSADFIVLPITDLPSYELYDFTYGLGAAYWGSGRIHYIYNEQMEYVRFLW